MNAIEPVGGGGGGVGAVTVTLADPMMLSLVARMVALPAPTAVTVPDDDTVATLALVVDQAIDRPVRIAPVDERTVAATVDVCPTWSDSDDGASVTLATGTGAGAVTVTLAVPV